MAEELAERQLPASSGEDELAAQARDAEALKWLAIYTMKVAAERFGTGDREAPGGDGGDGRRGDGRLRAGLDGDPHPAVRLGHRVSIR